MTGGGRVGGFVLVLVLVALVSLTLLAHGTLTLALLDRRVGSAGESWLQARAQAGLGLAVLRGRTDGARWAHDDPGAAQSVTRGGPAGSVHARAFPLDREWWLAEAVGRGTLPAATVRLQQAVWVPDAVTRVASARGVVEVAEGAHVSIRGEIEGRFVRRLDGPAEGDACRSIEPAFDSLGLGFLPATARVPVGPSEPSLGLLEGDALRALAPVHLSGTGTPAPATSGAGCVAGDWNWGDVEPGRPCSDRWVARSAPGDLAMEGGQGQGLLVVGGDLTLSGPVRFVGMMLVGGRLVVSGDARIRGLVRAAGGFELGPDARVVGSACAALQALDASGLPGRPHFIGRPWRMP